MKFTIISATYNQAKYIPQLIKSLQAQTFKDFEVIFADDASNDGTLDCIKGDLGFTYQIVRHRFHYGMRMAELVNKAIRKASGEYLVMIMGDSFPPADYLEQINRHINPLCVICGIRIHVDDDGKMVDEDYRLKTGLIQRFNYIVEQDCHRSFTGNGLVIPMKEIKAVGGWGKVRGYGSDDTILLFKLWARGLNFLSLYTLILYHHAHADRGTSTKNYRILDSTVRKFFTDKLKKPGLLYRFR